MLPNFFIVGAPKAGTTSLYHYLESHPDIYMSPIKEPNYFSYEEIIRQNLFYKETKVGNTEDYESLFNNVTTEKAVGEASVSYLFYESVPAKIKKLVPKARIIIMLRNPVERAFSHFAMDKRLGYVTMPFETIFENKSSAELSRLYYQQYIELGNYYPQIKRYVETFPPEQVKIFLLEDMKANTALFVKQLYKFLGVDENFIPDVSKKHNSNVAPRGKLMGKLYRKTTLRHRLRNLLPLPTVNFVKRVLFSTQLETPSRPTVLKLKAYYKNDVKQLEQFLQRDLRAWYE